MVATAKDVAGRPVPILKRAIHRNFLVGAGQQVVTAPAQAELMVVELVEGTVCWFKQASSGAVPEPAEKTDGTLVEYAVSSNNPRAEIHIPTDATEDWVFEIDASAKVIVSFHE